MRMGSGDNNNERVRKGVQRGEGEVRGVMCHIYTCIEGEEVGEVGRGGHRSRLALCCDRTLLPHKSISLSALCVCVATGSEL